VVPLPPAPERTLQVVGARRRAPGAPRLAEIVTTLRGLAGESDALVALFDAGAIAGERHLFSAWAHLGRSRGRGETRLRDRGAELALFVAGDDQLPRALEKVGVSDRTAEFVLVAEKPRETARLLDAFGLVADPSVYPRPPTAATLTRLGIGSEERDAVPESAWEGLVLERVALLELSAPAGRAATAKK
jgi:tRNA threonylcarbamoyladenosine modification (KEOPS) complex Cgi121 subunit